MNSALDVLKSTVTPDSTYIEFQFLDRKARIYIADFGKIMVEQNYNEAQLAISCRERYHGRKFNRKEWIEQRKRDAQAEIEALKSQKKTDEINKLITEKNKTLDLLEQNAPQDFAEYAKRIDSQFEIYKAVVPFLKDANMEFIFKSDEIEEALKLIETQFDLRTSINVAFNSLVERGVKAREMVKNS